MDIWGHNLPESSRCQGPEARVFVFEGQATGSVCWSEVSIA